MMAEKDLSNLDILSLVSDNQEEQEEEEKLEVQQTSAFERWFGKLRDRIAKARIAQYFDAAMARGSLSGDLKPVSDGVTEVRFDIGPGYRVYLTQEGNRLVLLLVGGDKSSQERDIKKAKRLAKKWRQEHEDN